jgi:hypothetical protein
MPTLIRRQSVENFFKKVPGFTMGKDSDLKIYCFVQTIKIVEDLGLEVWFSTYEPPIDRGYLFDTNKDLERFHAEFDKTEIEHSGYSFAEMCFILKCFYKACYSNPKTI